jgi:hypothetical protein
MERAVGRLMSLIVRVFVLFALVAGANAARAQSNDNPGVDIFTEGLVAPALESTLEPPADTLVAPESYAPPVAAGPAAPGDKHDLRLEARLVADGPVLTEGMTWRVFSTLPNAEGQLPLVETAEGGATTVRLAAGDYLVHAAFGRAGATKRVTIANKNQTESMVLDAGGLRLDATVGESQPIAPDQLSFEIQQQDETGEMVTVVPNATAGRVLRLSAGTYHVVSRYGNVNAVVRADIAVEAGKLTEAVMRHTGAEVTLKLVAAEGGEALANTSWTVTTQDGLEVHQSVGAFPSIVLAAGNYTAVAQHQNQIYSRDFTVEAGVARDIEVRLSDVVQPDVSPPASPGTGGEPMEP